jgi:hypothetical protein
VHQIEVRRHLCHFKYPVEGLDGTLIRVATTRPKTMLGDTAVGVHPDDGRHTKLVGRIRERAMTGNLPISSSVIANSITCRQPAMMPFLVRSKPKTGNPKQNTSFCLGFDLPALKSNRTNVTGADRQAISPVRTWNTEMMLPCTVCGMRVLPDANTCPTAGAINPFQGTALNPGKPDSAIVGMLETTIERVQQLLRAAGDFRW